MSKMNWYHGDFMTGEYKYSAPMPVIKGSSSVDISVDNEDTADLSISLKGMPVQVQNNWNEFYREMLDFMTLVNDDTKEVIFAGFVNKVTPNLKDQSLKFQLKSPSEYMKARIIGETLGEFTDATSDTRYFSGQTWSHVISLLVQRCFDSSLITKANAPLPPSIMGNYNPAPASGTKNKVVLITDALTYKEVIDEVALDDSGLGIEYRFVPRFTDGAYNKITWDLVVGSTSNPFINESNTLSIQLSNHEDWQKISEFSQQIDASRKYTSFYAQSKQGDEKTNTGADFSNVFIPRSEYPLLLEKFYSPGVELNRLELERQMNSYISYGLEDTRSGSITLELNEERFKVWTNSSLGTMVTFTAPENTIASGNSCKMRIIGARLNPDNGQVILDLASKSQRYPKLPRNRVKDMAENKKKNSKSPRNKNAKMKDSKLNSGGIGTPGTYPPAVGPGTETGAGIGGNFGGGGSLGENDKLEHGIFANAEVYDIAPETINDAQTIANVAFRWGTIIEGVNNRYVPWRNGRWFLTWSDDPLLSLRPTNTAVLDDDNGSVYTGGINTTAGNNYGIVQSSFYFENGQIVNFGVRDTVDMSLIIDDIVLSYESKNLAPKESGEHVMWSMHVTAQMPVVIRDKLYTPLAVDVGWSRGHPSEGHGTHYSSAVLFISQQILNWNKLAAPILTTTSYPRVSKKGDYPNERGAFVTNRIGDWIVISGTETTDTLKAAPFGQFNGNIAESQWVGFSPNPNDFPELDNGYSYRIMSIVPVRFWSNGVEAWYLSTSWYAAHVSNDGQNWLTRAMKIRGEGAPIPFAEGQPWEKITPNGSGVIINYGRWPLLIDTATSELKCYSNMSSSWLLVATGFPLPDDANDPSINSYIGYRSLSYGKYMYFGDKTLMMTGEVV